MFKRLSLSLAVLFLVITSIARTPTAGDWASRSTAAGVLLANGFDATSDMSPYLSSTNRASIDTIIKASGGGSLKFVIASKTNAGAAGSVDIPFGQTFGQNSTFYVQYRQRFSPDMVDADMSGDGWKQSNFHDQLATCGQVEITTENIYYRGLPQLYSSCGADNFRIPSPITVQWTSHYPNNQPGDVCCVYSTWTEPSCFMYHPNEWETYYYEVHIGTWGSANSYVKAWASHEGNPLQQIVNNVNWTATHQSGATGYSKVFLGPYITDKDPSFSHPEGYTWYDELIVSTQPIADPVTAAPPSPPPPPTNLTTVAGDTTATLNWTASTGATSYNVYRALAPGREGTTPYSSGISSNTFLDTGLTNGVTYYYTVATVNANGVSAFSNEASAKPTIIFDLVPIFYYQLMLRIQ